MQTYSWIPLILPSSAVLASLGYFSWAYQTYPPSSSADFAAWAGGIGSIGAILGAWIGIHAQLRHTEKLALSAARSAKKNVVCGLLAELEVYQTAIADIHDKISNSPSFIFGQMLQIVFPSTTFRFPVYMASAAHISAVRDVRLRSKVIGLYAEMDMLFALLDRNSAAVMRIPDGEAPSDAVRSELQSLHPLISGKTAQLLSQLRIVIDDLKLESESALGRVSPLSTA